MPDDASRLLTAARSGLGMSQAGAAIKTGIVLDGDEPPRRWIQHIESGPPCPLSNHRRLWAYFEVLGVDPKEYLTALGVNVDGRLARP